MTALSLILTAASLAVAPPLAGQGIVDKMKERARQQAAGRANRAADEAVDSAASAAERSVRCLISDAQCIKAAAEDSAAALAAADSLRRIQPASEWEPSGAPATPEYARAAALAATDFAEAPVGTVPADITVATGTFAVEEHEVESGRWLTGRARGGGSFFLPLSAKLPERFTLTFDVLGGGMVAVHPSGMPTGAHALVEMSGVGFINDGTGNGESGTVPAREYDVVRHIRVVGRDSTLVLYIDETKVAEATSAPLARRGKRIAFRLSVYGTPARIGGIRVIESGE